MILIDIQILESEEPVIQQPDNWRFQKAEGLIQFSKVEFQYPTRSEMQILQGLNLIVKPGQMVALVGQSGCGKSTCIQLLQRLYDPISGTVTLDRRDITSVSLRNLRSQLGVVGQEPVLFDRTIAENIAYGDNSRCVQMEEVIEAAKKSNIHSFVSSLPLVSNSLIWNGSILSRYLFETLPVEGRGVRRVRR